MVIDYASPDLHFPPVDLLSSGKSVKVHYRDRHTTFWQKDIDNFNRLFPPVGSSIFKRLFSYFYFILFYFRSVDYGTLSSYYSPRPQDLFSFVKYDKDLDFFFYPSRYYRWSNTSFLIDRTFFLAEILDRVEVTSTPISKLLNGYKCIEWQLNRAHNVPIFFRRFCLSWWSRQDYVVSFPESGLFIHNALGR